MKKGARFACVRQKLRFAAQESKLCFAAGWAKACFAWCRAQLRFAVQEVKLSFAVDRTRAWFAWCRAKLCFVVQEAKLRAAARALRTANRWYLVAGAALFAGLLLLPVVASLRRQVHPVVGPAGGAANGTQQIESRELSKVQKRVTVAAGDTLLGILARAGVGSGYAGSVVAALEPFFAPGDLQPGQTIDLTFTVDPSTRSERLAAARFEVDSTKEIVASFVAPGEFAARVVPLEVDERPALVAGTITESLYEAAQSAGLPLPVLMEMIRSYSFNVDFQRDVRHGDRFEVLYRRLFDAKGRYLGAGEMLFSALTLGGKRRAIYEFKTSAGFTDYFDGTGQSVRRMLMRTPVEGAWISSVFGWRKNPVNGYSEFHRGLDFAVPVNTPIMAAGNGTVVAAGSDSEYGNYVQLRHANGYQTLYAHMVAFARGIHAGASVAQGEVIGFVGTTGVSTGPHLHYEVIYHGERINPATVVSPAGPVLTGPELESFRVAKERIDAQYAALEQGRPLPSGKGGVAENPPPAHDRRS